MPRETIPTTNPGEPFEAVVTWTPSMSMQLGIQSVSGYNLLDVLTGRTEDTGVVPKGAEHGPVHRIGKAVEAVVLDYQSRVSEPDQDGYHILGGLILDAITGNTGGYTGIWVNFERPGVQKLLRVAKRARNAVWGADE